MAHQVLAWSVAWEASSFADGGFYRRSDGRAEQHFATHVTDGPATARRILGIAMPTLRTLIAQHGTVAVTDVGAGDGTLLRQLGRMCPTDVSAAIRWRGIDLRERPGDLPPDVEWVAGDIRGLASGLTPSAGLVVAHELLDDVPCDVVEADDDGRSRLVTVDPRTGMEYLGPDLDDDVACRELGVDAARARSWLEEWWPGGEPASRREVGAPRDDVWRAVAGTISDGLAIAIDFGHTRRDRVAGRWDGGTITGHRDGRLVSPVPDGSCNVTAHVAVDACAAFVRARSTRLDPSPAGDDFWWLVHEMGR